MSTKQEEQNVAMAERMIEASNSHDDDLISATADEIFHPDVETGAPLPVDATGAQAVKEITRKLHSAFPDLHIAAEELIAKDDKVVSRQLVTGTHTGGEFMGVPATGKSVSYDEIFIFRFADGRIVETKGVVNQLAQMTQLGVVQL